LCFLSRAPDYASCDPLGTAGGGAAARTSCRRRWPAARRSSAQKVHLQTTVAPLSVTTVCVFTSPQPRGAWAAFQQNASVTGRSPSCPCGA